MKNKENDDICVCNSTGEFIDWLFDFISSQEIKYGNNPELFNVVQEFRDCIQDKLEEE